MANTTVYPYGTGGSLPSSIGIINDLVTGGADKALAAEQGVILNGKIDELSEGASQNYTAGKYLGNTPSGIVENVDAAWGITDYIPYTYPQPVDWRWQASGSASGKLIVFYDAQKNIITNGYWGANNSSGARTISTSDIQQYAQNAAYIRASFKLDDSTCNVKINEAKVWQQQEEAIGIQQLQEEIESITSPTTASSNKFKESAIVSIAAKIGTQSPKAKNNYLCLLHISDLHGDVERMKRAIAFANSQNNIAAILATGDFQQSQWTDDGFDKTFDQLYQTANVPMLPVIGNHEVSSGGKKIYTPTNSNEAVGAKYITPYMSALGCVQGGTDAGYYYKDFGTFKVRLIVLNEYEMPRVPNSGNTELKYSIWARYLSSTQASWFVQTLNSVQSGWSVIVAFHQLIDIFPKYDNEFKGAVNYSGADGTYAQIGIIQDIVDAYISRGTLSKTYTVANVDTTEVPDVTVSADFTSANGTFICYINGHTHNDGTGQSSVATNKQVDINITTGSADLQLVAVYDDLYRDNDSMAQDAFNMVAFDTDRKEIRMLRIGANVAMDMKRRDYACISYAL